MATDYADRSTDNPTVLVTGGTGHLGRWLLARLTARGERVLVPIRRASERGDELRSFVRSLGGDGALLSIVEGDLDRPQLGLDEAALARLASVRVVHHLGARFAWGLTPAEAQRTNVEGSLRVVELAATMPSLERLVLVGGYRIAERLDRRGRRIPPEAISLGRVGAYEASKHAAHRECVRRAKELSVPYSAMHPATVIGDSRTGRTVQTTGLGETVLALAQGRLPARVGGKSVFVPIVAVDLVAEVLDRIATDDEALGLELTLFDPASPTLDGLLERAARVLGVRAPSLRLPIGLVRLLPESISKTSREALEFLDDARYPHEATDAFLARHGIAHPELEATYEKWVRFLAASVRPEAA